MNNAGRIAVIAVIAVVAFGGAFVLAGGDEEADDAATDVAAGAQSTTTTISDDEEEGVGDEEETEACQVSDVVPMEEAGYDVTVATEPDPPAPEDTTIEVLVEQEGAPVPGASVCVSVDMSTMNHAGVRRQADELGEGRYEVAVDFGMRGQWDGNLIIFEPGQPAATMAVSFNVQ